MRRLYLAAAAAGSLVALVATTPGFAAEVTAPRLTQPQAVTNGDDAPGHSFSSPTVVVDPDDPLLVYAASVDVRSLRCALLRSADGGRTWTRSTESPSPAGFPFCTHDNGFIPLAFLAMGRDKTLYYLHIGWDTQDGGRAENRSVFVARTRDGGETWQSTPVNVNRGKQNLDIEKNVPAGLVVDTVSGATDVVYAAYRASWPNPVAPAPIRTGQSFVVTSTDGGQTFGAPVNLSAAYFEDASHLPASVADASRKKENFGGSAGWGTVDGKGDLIIPWTFSTANITPVAPPSPFLVATSSDQGKTFTMTEVQPASEDASGPTGPMVRWTAQGAPGGSLHAVWEGKLRTTQGDRDILYKRSVDGGKTWSEVKVLNDDDPTQLFAQFHPTLAVSPNGRLGVVWWDLRDGKGRFVNDVYYAASTDSGATWARNERISDRSVDRTFGIWKPGTGGDVRQPPGIGAADRLTVVVWDDTRNGNPTTEQQDLFAATLQYKALTASGLSPAAGYALAAVLGVLAVGVVLGLGALAMRARQPGPPPPSTTADTGKEPAGVA